MLIWEDIVYLVNLTSFTNKEFFIDFSFMFLEALINFAFNHRSNHVVQAYIYLHLLPGLGSRSRVFLAP